MLSKNVSSLAIAAALTTFALLSACGDSVATPEDAGTVVSDSGADVATGTDGSTTKDAAVLDASTTKDATATDASDASTTDAATDASTTDAATDGSTTDGSTTDGGVATYKDIVINEAQSQETTGYLPSDFVELYNRAGAAYTFGAGEWYLTDSDPAHTFYVPGGTTIPAHGFLVLLPDEATVPVTTPAPPAGSLACVQGGTNSAPFGLGGTDGVSLYFTGTANPTPAVAVDATSWAAHVKTRARVPDGDAWSAVDTHKPTPGALNE